MDLLTSLYPHWQLRPNILPVVVFPEIKTYNVSLCFQKYFMYVLFAVVYTLSDLVFIY